jgi:hypothetical protein
MLAAKCRPPVAVPPVLGKICQMLSGSSFWNDAEALQRSTAVSGTMRQIKKVFFEIALILVSKKKISSHFSK